jgi:hypothetical protein
MNKGRPQVEGTLWIAGTLVIAGVWIVNRIYKAGSKLLTQGFLEGRDAVSNTSDRAQIEHWLGAFESMAVANRILRNGDLATKQEGMVLAGMVHLDYIADGRDQWSDYLGKIKFYHRELLVAPQYQAEVAMRKRELSRLVLQNIATTGDVPW